MATRHADAPLFGRATVASSGTLSRRHGPILTCMPAPHGHAPLHVVHLVATANGAAWMHQMLRELRARGHRVTAIIGGRGGTLERRLLDDGIPFHVLDLDVLASRNALTAARKVIDLVRLLRRLRPDVAHFHLFPSIILGRIAAWIADVPVRVSMIPGPYYLEAPVLGDIDVRTTRFDSKVIASCEYTRTLYARAGVPRDHVELVYYGQDAALYDRSRADGQRVRREWGLGADVPIVGDVAYFYPPLPDNPFTPRHLVGRGVKGHDVLLRAIPRVLARVPNAVFVLVGEGWGPGGSAYVASLQQLATSLEIAHAVRFVGARTDIPDTLAAFDVSVQCSLNENLGGSVESLMLGRALVASDVGGLPDAVRHEDTGLLVPPGDPVALGDAIVRLLCDRALAARLAENGWRFAMERLTLDRAVDQLEVIYHRERDALTDARARRGYRWWQTLKRLAWIGPWARRELLAPIRDALRRTAIGTASLAPGAGARVVHIASATHNADWLVDFCRELRDRGYAVSAITGAPDAGLGAQLTAAHVPHFTMPMSFAGAHDRFRTLAYALRVPWVVLRLARSLRASRIQVTHTHIFASMLIGRVAAWLARVPHRISMVPGPLHLEAPVTRWLDRMTWWMDHRVVAGSEYTRGRYAALGMTAPRLQCIPYGADASRFDPARADGARVRAALGIDASTPLVGLIAYFYPPRDDWQTPPHVRGRGVKGHDDFLAAARIVHERHPAARFLLVGDGWGEAGARYRDALRARAIADGLGDTCTFLGHHDDVPGVLAALDVAVQCSLSENHGGTIESLLMACATIATRVGGMPETVRHGDTGLLVPPSDPAALAAAICRMLDDPADARRMAAAGRALMLERYTRSRAAADLAAMYQQLCDERLRGSARSDGDAS